MKTPSIKCNSVIDYTRATTSRTGYIYIVPIACFWIIFHTIIHHSPAITSRTGIPRARRT
ncbi:MAG TPA: hypothetical protein PLO64_00190 [Methanothermobacter sp.]|nr:hypothetical protein METMT2_1141 [Methanothermobacter sp. MT-2]HHW04569.1 hypothetical protein [Methanothermobacter sp.]HOK72033.1 hypothetical protein [Methanothermobacter sp.]HOL68346.1 hypothetical protein [Methanothermobacter sp.]HPQ04104.1 hypothetical protein [Methanothermobacter sp.]